MTPPLVIERTSVGPWWDLYAGIAPLQVVQHGISHRLRLLDMGEMATVGQHGERGVNDLSLIHVPMAYRHHAVLFPPNDERRAFDPIEIARKSGIVWKLPGKPGQHLSSLEHGLN